MFARAADENFNHVFEHVLCESLNAEANAHVFSYFGSCFHFFLFDFFLPNLFHNIVMEHLEKQPKRSRKQILDEAILKKYQQTKKYNKLLNGEENSDAEQVNQEESEEISVQEHKEAYDVLDEVNELQKKKKKSLAKSKKKFKLQQKEENKETKKDKALSYLKQWKKHRDEWKFKKNMHIWLLKNWKHSNRISDKKFKTLLKYLKTIETKSSAVKRLESECQKLVDSGNSDEEINSSYERARNILQWIGWIAVVQLSQLNPGIKFCMFWFISSFFSL